MLENSGGDTGGNERFATLSDAYRSIVKAMQNEELGRAQYLCVK